MAQFIHFKLDTSKLETDIMNLYEEKTYSRDTVNDILKKVSQTHNLEGKAIDDGTTAEISYTIPEQDPGRPKQFGFLDMKPYFARSSKVKYKKDGGWYLTIPIRNKTRDLRSTLSSAEYDKLTHLAFGQSMEVDGLEQADNTIDELKYAWKSSKVTRMQQGSGNRGTYMSFRTVSDKSSPSSWILNRESTTNENTDAIDRAKIAQQLRDNLIQTLTN